MLVRFQMVYLGMTTNERLNAGRYKHFHRTPKQPSWLRHSKFNSPFDRGICQNTADLFELRVSFCGKSCLQPQRIDWKTEFNIDKWINDDEEKLLSNRGVNNV